MVVLIAVFGVFSLMISLMLLAAIIASSRATRMEEELKFTPRRKPASAVAEKPRVSQLEETPLAHQRVDTKPRMENV